MPSPEPVQPQYSLRAHAEYSHSTYGIDSYAQRSRVSRNVGLTHGENVGMWAFIIIFGGGAVLYAVFAVAFAFRTSVLIGIPVLLLVLLWFSRFFIDYDSRPAKGPSSAPEIQRQIQASIQTTLQRNAKARGLAATVRFGEPSAPHPSRLVLIGRVALSNGREVDAEWTATRSFGRWKWEATRQRHIVPTYSPSACVRCGNQAPTEGLWCSKCAIALRQLAQAPIDPTSAAILQKDSELLVQRRPDRVDLTHSPSYQGHRLDRQSPFDRDEARRLDAETHRGCSSIHLREQILIQDGERIWQGATMELEGPGGTMSTSAVAANRIVDGLITETWSYLGKLPTVQGTAEPSQE